MHFSDQARANPGQLGPDNTCGYVDGLSVSSKTCDPSQRCAGVIIDDVATMGCCETAAEACTWYGNCVGYRGYWSSSLCGAACQADINTLKCTNSARPYCYSYMIPRSSIGFYSCASTFSSDFDRFETTYSGQVAVRTWKKVYDTDSAAASSVLIPTTSLGTGKGFVLTAAASSGSDGAAATTDAAGAAAATDGAGSSTGSTGKIGKKGKKSSVGGIVGGVVGGLLALGAIVAGIIFVLLKKKKNKNNATPAVAGAPGAGPDMSQQPQYQQPGPDMSQQQQYQQPSQDMSQQQQQYQQPGAFPQQQSQPQYQTPGQYAAPAQYNVGQYDNQNINGGTQNGAAGYYAAFPDKSNDGNYANKDAITVTEQQVPLTPQPPQSPAPPYTQPIQNRDMAESIISAPSPAISPAPQMMQGQFHQAPVQPQQPVELGTNHSVPRVGQDGKPIYEAA